MTAHRPPSRRPIASLLLAFSLLSALVVGATAPPASAELSDSSEPVGGVAGIMASQSNNFQSPVWALETIGDTMYVGGKFTSTTTGQGGQTTNQAALAAMDSRTGQWISTFQPDVRGGSVFAITASPDGSRLFIGGDFTSIGGAADTAGLAAVDPTTGALDPTWRAGLERPWTTDLPVARSLDVNNGWLYVGGTFTHVRSGSSYQQHLRVARVNLNTGKPDAAFDPVISGGGVWDIDPSPDGSRLYVVGFFSSVNGDADYGDRFTAIQTSDGELVPGVEEFVPNLEQTGRQYAVVATDSKVFVAGEEHLLQVLDGTSLTREQVYYTGTNPDSGVWALSGGGDFQVLEQVGDRVYAGCHCWSQHLNPSTGAELFPTVSPNPGVWTPVRGLLTYDANTGDHLVDVTFDMSGASGPWAISGSSDDCLWVGGQMTRSGGNWNGNLARFCDESFAADNERPSAPKGLDADAGASEITLSWLESTDDTGVTGYQIYRSTDGSLGTIIDTVTDLTYTDTTATADTTYTYAIKAIDAAGNTSWRSNQAVIANNPGADTERPSAPTGLMVSTIDDEVTLTWNESNDNVGVESYEVLEIVNGSIAAVVTTSATTSVQIDDLEPGSMSFAIRAVDAAGNTSWRSNTVTVTIG